MEVGLRWLGCVVWLHIYVGAGFLVGFGLFYVCLLLGWCGYLCLVVGCVCLIKLLLGGLVVCLFLRLLVA